MAHRAETIMAAVVTAVTGLTTTGANVFRDRSEFHDVAELELPALLVSEGEEDLVAESHNDEQQWALEIFVDIAVAVTAGAVGTTVNLIRSEVTAALAADITLGGACEAIRETGAGTPDHPGRDRAVAGRRMAWRVDYRRNRTNPDI